MNRDELLTRIRARGWKFVRSSQRSRHGSGQTHTFWRLGGREEPLYETSYYDGDVLTSALARFDIRSVHVVNQTKLHQALNEWGWSMIRNDDGSHTVWANSEGKRVPLALSHRASGDMSGGLLKSVLKKFDLALNQQGEIVMANQGKMVPLVDFEMPKDWGFRLKQARENEGIGQGALAKVVARGNQSMISSLERGIQKPNELVYENIVKHYPELRVIKGVSDQLVTRDNGWGNEVDVIVKAGEKDNVEIRTSPIPAIPEPAPEAPEAAPEAAPKPTVVTKGEYTPPWQPLTTDRVVEWLHQMASENVKLREEVSLLRKDAEKWRAVQDLLKE